MTVELEQGTGAGQKGGVLAGTPVPPTPPGAPGTPGPVPPGENRIVFDKDDFGRTTITGALPPQIMPLARMAQETAFGLMAALVAIFVLGPFARMFARRLERRSEIAAPQQQTLALQQQLEQLQASIDTMSVEVERISESQRFQSKLLAEKRTV